MSNNNSKNKSKGILMITKHESQTQTAYVISNQFLNVTLNPSDGMNLYEINYMDTPIVKFYKDRLEEGKTCSVMTLFPTPNRTKDLHYSFEGKTYSTLNHGVVRHAPFTVSEIRASENGGVIRAYLDFHSKIEQNVVKELSYFPFDCRLSIEIELDRNNLTYRYSVENKGEKIFPYGIAIHPFFETNGENPSITVHANHRMGMDENKIPTGELIEVKDAYDLRHPQKVNSLSLDDVYTSIYQQPVAEINYEDKVIHLSTSDEFKKVVVYTPNEPQFFCIENQTCSTDAINLHNRGFEREASVLVVKPGEIKDGFIQFTFLENISD